MVVYLVIDGIELVIDGFDDIVHDSNKLEDEFLEWKWISNFDDDLPCF